MTNLILLVGAVVLIGWIVALIADAADIDRHVDDALNETKETFDPMALPLSQSRTAQRIRAQIEANHEAEVARFRDELDNYGGAA